MEAGGGGGGGAIILKVHVHGYLKVISLSNDKDNGSAFAHRKYLWGVK